MDRNTARELALSRKMSTLKREKIEPGDFVADFAIHDDGAGNQVDDRLELREFTGAEGMQFNTERDTLGVSTAVGNLLVKVIMLPNGSSETLFNQADRDELLGFGSSVLNPLLRRVRVLSGDVPASANTTPTQESKNG